MSRPLRRGARGVVGLARGDTPTHRDLRARVIFVFAVTLVLDLGASALVLLFEREVPGTEITNIGDSLFWTSTQLLTVSSQLKNPISTEARILDVFLQAYAISAVAALAGSFASFFHRRSAEKDDG